jgi:hypothetical protein
MEIIYGQLIMGRKKQPVLYGQFNLCSGKWITKNILAGSVHMEFDLEHEDDEAEDPSATKAFPFFRLGPLHR